MSESSIQAKVLGAKGKEVGTVALSEAVFGVKPNDALLYQCARWQRNKARAGTHAVQTRALMTGGGIKPWKQKGTGRARAGSNTSPLWVGGGIAHGPKPRSYEFGLNKKERQAALKSALSARASEGRITIAEEASFSSGRTKDAALVLSKAGVKTGEPTLVVLQRSDEKAWKSLRNISGVTLVEPQGLNVFDVLYSRRVVLCANTVDAVTERSN